MREVDLRQVLLVKAIEEHDPEGAVLPPADRAAAGREAARRAPGDEQAMMVERSGILRPGIGKRYPFVEAVLARLGGTRILTVVMVIAGLSLGAALSALDGTRRINILAFPLAGLLAWNLLAYVLLAAWALRAHRAPGPLRLWAASLGASLASRLVARSRAFNAPLAAALDSFAREWYAAAQPLLLARAAVAFHLAAAAVGVGLIAGLYLRGIAFDYRAGWESTFLEASRARELLALMYGPASWLTGIPIPDAAQLEATRWRAQSGGESAARWIHLMAATAFLVVVVPRTFLAAVSLAKAWGLAARAPLPDSLRVYFRNTFAGVAGAAGAERVLILPYACDLSPGALARLIAWIPSATGGTPEIDARAGIAYGEEERYLAELRGGAETAGILVLPFSLAATPEDENHGVVIAGARDWLAQRAGTQLLIAIDEAPYAQRMAAAPGRMEERRAAWRSFVEARGLKPHFVSLA